MKQEKDIWTYRVHSRRLTICYTPESIRHPAKMHLGMCRQIIKLYSKKGDTILDPMAGIGTTIIEGMLLGRNIIGVEYEQKFVDLAEANIKKTNEKCSFIKSLGKGLILKGDSRELDKLFLHSTPNAIVFSPPFADANTCGNKNQGNKQKKQWRDNRIKGGSGFLNKIYSEDKDNIGNQKYGEVDSVIMSPPFSEVNHKTNYLGKQKKESGSEYSDDKENIGNLPHGNIDVIMTSPPYAHESTHRRNQEITLWRKEHNYNVGHDKEINYSENKENLGNMKYPVDTIVTSPPYNETEIEHLTHMTSNKRGDENNPNYRPSWKKKLKEGYAESKRPYSQPDTIITSPPYEEGIGHGGGRKNPGVNRDKGIWTQGKGSYSKDKNNIGEKRGKNYLTEMYKIYVQCFLILKNNGFMILVTKNFVRKAKQIRLDLDTIKLVEKSGFKLIKRHYRVIDNPSFWITNAIQKYEKKYPGKQHPYPLEEDILVFQKNV